MSIHLRWVAGHDTRHTKRGEEWDMHGITPFSGGLLQAQLPSLGHLGNCRPPVAPSTGQSESRYKRQGAHNIGVRRLDFDDIGADEEMATRSTTTRTYPVVGANAIREGLLLLAYVLVSVISLQAQHIFVVLLPTKGKITISQISYKTIHTQHTQNDKNVRSRCLSN